MAKREATPIDELTGLPLPLVPLDSFGENPNWHHHFHPKSSPLLKGYGGLAVRQCRLQRYEYDLHNHEYHHNFTGPPLPETAEERFTTIVMAVAGYMPHEAIDVREGTPKIVNLSQDQRRRLQTSGEIRLGTESLVKKFIKDYVLSQGIDAIDATELVVDEFVTTTDEDRRRVLGHNFLGMVISKATEPADEIYFQASKKEMLTPGLADNAQKFIKAKLGPTKSRDKLVDTLYDHLATI